MPGNEIMEMLTLEREELQGLLVGVSVGGVMGDVTGEDIQGWFKKFDENSTGDIDRDEFRRAAHAWIDEICTQNILPKPRFCMM